MTTPTPTRPRSRPLIVAADCPTTTPTPETAPTPARLAGLCIDTRRPVQRRPGRLVAAVGGWMVAALDLIATTAAAIRDEMAAELSTPAR